MGNALDFLNKHMDNNDTSIDKIEEFIEEKGTTKVEDSTRNSEDRIAKYKTAKRDRGLFISSPYDGLLISKGHMYRLTQLRGLKNKQHGYNFRAVPTTSKGKPFHVMETELKRGITKGEIMIRKEKD
jgi:hypothetical protein